MTDYYCTLAKVYDADKHDVTGWVWSEKLDGVRALWRPDEGRFVSRSNKPLNVPPSWLKMMAEVKIPLDGEFFMGRGRFNETISAVRKKAPTEEQFIGVKYAVFDAVVEQADFAERLSMAEMAVARVKDTRLFVHLHTTVTNMASIGVAYLSIMASGGEGIMFRNPGSQYEFKRTSNLLKMKGEIDGKATVRAIQPGKGKHEGRMGALEVDAFYEGKAISFEVGTGFTDEERQWWWDNDPVGQVIRWRGMELTVDDSVRFPVYVCRDEGD